MYKHQYFKTLNSNIKPSGHQNAQMTQNKTEYRFKSKLINTNKSKYGLKQSLGSDMQLWQHMAYFKQPCYHVVCESFSILTAWWGVCLHYISMALPGSVSTLSSLYVSVSKCVAVFSSHIVAMAPWLGQGGTPPLQTL